MSELGKTVEAVLSSRKHPGLLKQLNDNVDSLQKSRCLLNFSQHASLTLSGSSAYSLHEERWCAGMHWAAAWPLLCDSKTLYTDSLRPVMQGGSAQGVHKATP